MSKMFQGKYKMKFLESLDSIELQRQYKWLFNKSFEYENYTYNRDLFDFKEDQLLEFLKSLKLSRTSVQTYSSIIIRYVKWAIEKGIKLNTKISAENITSEQKDSVAVDGSIYDVDFIYELIGKRLLSGLLPKYNLRQLDNVQDQLLIYLAFLGIKGTAASELINLTINDIDFENKKILLSNLDPYRKDITVDDYCLDLIKLSRNEQHYYRRSKSENRYDYVELVQSPYIFRTIETARRTDPDGKMGYPALLRRLEIISEEIGWDISLKKIEDSGKLYVASLLQKNAENLDARNPITQEFLFDRFNMSVVDGKVQRKHLELVKKLKDQLNKVYPTKVSEV